MLSPAQHAPFYPFVQRDETAIGSISQLCGFYVVTVFIPEQAMLNNLSDASWLQGGFIASSCCVEGGRPARRGQGDGDPVGRATVPLGPQTLGGGQGATCQRCHLLSPKKRGTFSKSKFQCRPSVVVGNQLLVGNQKAGKQLPDEAFWRPFPPQWRLPPPPAACGRDANMLGSGAHSPQTLPLRMGSLFCPRRVWR